MAQYYGEIEPIGNRWVWPFARMEPGDYFHVDHAERAPGALRNMASVRGAQLGKYFSMVKDDPEKPGFAKVTCTLPPEERPSAKGVPCDFDYPTMKNLLTRWYLFDFDDVPEDGMRSWEPRKQFMKRIKDPGRDRVVAPWRNERPVGMILEEDGITFVPLPEHWTCETWRETEDQLAVIQAQRRAEYLRKEKIAEENWWTESRRRYTAVDALAGIQPLDLMPESEAQKIIDLFS